MTFPSCAQGNRTAFQEISVSLAEAVPAASLNGSSSVPVTFNFASDPIPVNATDLDIQVVYRGPLGEESDGIAVGHFDVREPTYITLWNNSDYAGCNGAWVTGTSAGCSYPSGVGRGIDTARLCIGSQLVYTRFASGGNGNIFLGHYARLATLLDDQSKASRGRLLVGTTLELVILNKQLTGQSRQNSLEVETPQASYLPDPMFTKRGVIGGFRPMPFYLMTGADPQPSNDSGPSDVGALTQALTVPALPDTGGTISFPNSPTSSPGCTSPTVSAYYDDEIEALQ